MWTGKEVRMGVAAVDRAVVAECVQRWGGIVAERQFGGVAVSVEIAALPEQFGRHAFGNVAFHDDARGYVLHRLREAADGGVADGDVTIRVLERHACAPSVGKRPGNHAFDFEPLAVLDAIAGEDRDRKRPRLTSRHQFAPRMPSYDL